MEGRGRSRGRKWSPYRELIKKELRVEKTIEKSDRGGGIRRSGKKTVVTKGRKDELVNIK